MKTLKRRRKEHKTDYKRRIGLLKSEIPRIVFRKSNRYLSAQYIVHEEAQDKIIFSLNSKNLLKYGWPEDMKGSLKSIPAAYLLGLLSGKEIIKKKLEIPILDLGMIRSIEKSKPFAFIQGAVDSGIKLKTKESSLPEKERTHGKSLKKDFSVTFNRIKEKIGESK